jgi:hypothetical protein
MCPECKGRGWLMKLWPLNAISMPHELAWQRFTCWRCKGSGKLPENDPYVRRTKEAVATLVWFWMFAGSTLFTILMLWL